MDSAWWTVGRWGVAVLLASYIGVSGFKKKSLNKGGAIAGFAVGLVSLGLSLRLGALLILFYKSSSILTKVGFDEKAKLTADYKEGGQRGAVQVLSCSLFATVLAVAHRYLTGVGDSLVDCKAQPLGGALLCAYLGFYACCAGDTWSSELGILSRTKPRLITKLSKIVPPGTNGGVTPMGTIASVAAGLTMGVGFVVFGFIFRLSPPASASSAEAIVHVSFSSQLPLVFLGALSGFVGSILDSLMGAVFQATYFDTSRLMVNDRPSRAAFKENSLVLLCGWNILSNEQVNVLSAVLTSVLAGWFGRFLL
eukprot:jgi/Undpi1/3654/HiC_scaffold_16.g07024.m1